MSTVYSLICFGGRTGKTVTFTDAGDVVNLTSHGLRPGTGVVFSTSGSLPTGLSAGTTYYAKQGADANKCLLYPTSADAIAGTNQVTFSGTGTGTHTVKGAYFSGLTSDQKARYGSAGSERIYDGLAAWNTGRSGASSLDEEICEIGEAWTDISTTALTINIPAGRYAITTMVNGVRSAGFHGGVVGAGYVWKQNAGGQNGLSISGDGSLMEGFQVEVVTGWYSSIVAALTGFRAEARNMIFVGGGTANGYALRMQNYGVRASNCLAMNAAVGFSIDNYKNGLVLTNCTATKNATGIAGANYAPSLGYFFNNVSLGNTTNWSTGTYGYTAATNNAGGTAEAWNSATGTRIEITEASPFSATFTDWANNVLTPKDASSQLVDAGVEYYGSYAYDLGDDVRPSYENGTTTYYDVGAYEFDHGYGPWPATFTLTLENVVTGSRVFVEDQAGTTTHFDQVATGSTVVIAVTVYGDSRDDWRVRVRKGSATPFYQPWETIVTAVAGAQSIYVSQIPDE